jgi:hypothetical protein
MPSMMSWARRLASAGGENEGRGEAGDETGERGELQEEEEVAAELLKGGVCLDVLDGATPEEDGGDDEVAAAELEEIEQYDGAG